MITLRQVKLRNVQNVAASKTCLIDLPIGPRYHTILLEHGYASGTNTIAAAMANLSEIRLKIDGKVRRVFSGTQLRDLNLFNGTQYGGTGVPNTSPGSAIAIHLAEVWRKDVDSQIFGAIPTVWNRGAGKFSSFQLEIDIGAASTPTLVAAALVDDVVPTLAASQAAPSIVEIQRLSVGAAGTTVDISTIDKKGVLLQLSLYSDSTNDNQASNIELRKNGQVIKEFTSSGNFALLSAMDMYPTASGRTAKITDIVFDPTDVLRNGEDLSNAAELTLTVSAASTMAGTITAIAQRVMEAN